MHEKPKTKHIQLNQVICLAISFAVLFSIQHVAAVGFAGQEAEAAPYASDSLLVKLEGPVDQVGTFSVTEEDSQGDGRLELLFYPDSGQSGFRTYGMSDEAWYVLHLDETEDVEEVKRQLEDTPSVLSVTYNYRIYTMELPEPEEPAEQELSTFAASQQWHLDRCGLPEAQAYLQQNGFPEKGSDEIIVAVIDTGVDYTHPDLTGNILRDANGSVIGEDTRSDDHDPMPEATSKQNVYDRDHGTHCAGIIAASGALSASGVAPQVKIMPIKIFDLEGGTVADLIAGIEFAHEHGAHIASMSVGLPATGAEVSAMETALEPFRKILQKYEKDMLFVAAAGNYTSAQELAERGYPNEPVAGVSSYQVTFPAAWPEVIGVMSCNASADENGDWKSYFSKWDPQLGNTYDYNVMAPGASIYSTLPDGQYGRMSGTSQATPFVAGCAALLLTKYSAQEEFTIQDVKRILTDYENVEMKQGITVGSTAYQLPMLRIDRALEYRTQTPVKIPQRQYYLQTGSERSPGATALAREGLALRYYYKNAVYGGTASPNAPGTYDVNASVDSIYYQGEDNGLYIVTKEQGDFNGDGNIDWLDLEAYRSHVGGRASASGTAGERYDAFLDLDGDGKINFRDLMKQYTKVRQLT